MNQKRAVSESVYGMERRALRTDFVDTPQKWSPWEREEDANDLLQRMERQGVRTWLKEYNSHFWDLGEAAQQAVMRYGLHHNAARRHRAGQELWGCRIGRTGWAFGPTVQEAVGRAYLEWVRLGKLARWNV